LAQQRSIEALHKGNATEGDYKLQAKYKALKVENKKLKEILK
jgi:hypothetical protein